MILCLDRTDTTTSTISGVGDRRRKLGYGYNDGWASDTGLGQTQDSNPWAAAQPRRYPHAYRLRSVR